MADDDEIIKDWAFLPNKGHGKFGDEETALIFQRTGVTAKVSKRTWMKERILLFSVLLSCFFSNKTFRVRGLAPALLGSVLFPAAAAVPLPSLSQTHMHIHCGQLRTLPLAGPV